MIDDVKAQLIDMLGVKYGWEETAEDIIADVFQYLENNGYKVVKDD